MKYLQKTYPNREVTFALSYSLLVRLPLVRSAGLWHIGGLLPPQALTKLVHLRGHVLPGTANTRSTHRISYQVAIDYFYSTSSPSSADICMLCTQIIPWVIQHGKSDAGWTSLISSISLLGNFGKRCSPVRQQQRHFPSGSSVDIQRSQGWPNVELAFIYHLKKSIKSFDQ